MKRFLWLLAIATVTSCGVSSHAIEEMDEISYIMYNYWIIRIILYIYIPRWLIIIFS
jgi:hypothetical protein